MQLKNRFMKMGEKLLTIAFLPFLPVELIARILGIEEKLVEVGEGKEFKIGGIEPTRKEEAGIEIFEGQVKTFDDIAIIIDKDKKAFHTWLDERIAKYGNRNIRIIVELQTK